MLEINFWLLFCYITVSCRKGQRQVRFECEDPTISKSDHPPTFHTREGSRGSQDACGRRHLSEAVRRRFRTRDRASE